MTRGFDPAMYIEALPLYIRNLGVLFPPLVAALIAIGLNYFSSWFFAAIGGAGGPLIQLLENILFGFAFAIAVIFADDAWRHGRASLQTAWNEGRRKAGNIVMAVIGFLFLVWIARMIGGITGLGLVAFAVGALAVWAFIYAIPAAAIGGIPGGASLSVSLESARRSPAATALLVIVCFFVAIVFGIMGWFAPVIQIARYLPFYGIGGDIVNALLQAIGYGYIALVVSKQYNELAFRALR